MHVTDAEAERALRAERAVAGAETLADIAHYMRQEVPPVPGAHITKLRVREILCDYADRIEAAARLDGGRRARYNGGQT